MITDLPEVAARLGRLFSPKFEIVVGWYEKACCWYEITAWKDGRRVDWTMTSEDLLLSDSEILTRFIKPAKSVFPTEPTVPREPK